MNTGDDSDMQQNAPTESMLLSKIRAQELEIQLLRQQQQDLEAELQRLLSSSSWRLTAPVRALTRAASRLRASLRPRSVAVRLPVAESALPFQAKNIRETLPSDDSFVFYRIIGNDIHPRHRKGQTLENLQFILDHEPDLPDCEKRFVINRIRDPQMERRVMEMIAEKGHAWIHIPYEPEGYRQAIQNTQGLPEAQLVGLEAAAQERFLLARNRHRINYVTNNNGARNAALAEGRWRAKWVMPWDGNCFLTAAAWQQIRADMQKQRDARYFVVPMARMLDNAALINGGELPKAVEEPQIMFRADARELFNPEFCYGHRDKVELLWRLGVKGPWQEYADDPWDLPRAPVSTEAKWVGWAGWVARLFSGMPSLEKDSDLAALHRGQARSMGIKALLEELELELGKGLSQ